MGFKIAKELMVAVGSFQKDGETKKKWKHCGKILEDDNGGKLLFIDRTFNFSGVPVDPSKPGSAEMVLVSMFDPREPGAGGAPQRSMSQSEWKDRKPASQPKPDDGDIPF